MEIFDMNEDNSVRYYTWNINDIVTPCLINKPGKIIFVEYNYVTVDIFHDLRVIRVSITGVTPYGFTLSQVLAAVQKYRQTQIKQLLLKEKHL